MLSRTITIPLSLLAALLLVSCGRKTPDAGNESGLVPVTFQSDWFAQPEYAGFYQALATGRYAQHGLDVTIVEGGPNADPMKRLLLKRCDFINGRSDDALVSFARGMPLRMVGITMQHNPESILSHAENPITDFRQLDGRRIMTNVAAPWLDYIERRYNIRVVRMPHNFGLSHFLNDQQFIMSCFLTQEPFYVREQGADPVVLPLMESGFDTYRGILAHADTVRDRPEVVRAFVQATHEAWHDYLYGDPSPAHALIASRNPAMTPEFMAFIRQNLLDYGMITGNPSDPANIGKMDEARLKTQIDQLHELGLIEKKFDFREVFIKLHDSEAYQTASE
jgi:NitT/TauT family transport system substrate-binding protein